MMTEIEKSAVKALGVAIAEFAVAKGGRFELRDFEYRGRYGYYSRYLTYARTDALIEPKAITEKGIEMCNGKTWRYTDLDFESASGLITYLMDY